MHLGQLKHNMREECRRSDDPSRPTYARHRRLFHSFTDALDDGVSGEAAKTNFGNNRRESTRRVAVFQRS